MARSTLVTLTVLLVLAADTFAQDLSVEEVRQELLQRIQAANVTVPNASETKSLQSYRIIDPNIIADLLTALAFTYVSIITNYPKFELYDVADLKLLSVRYRPQRVEFNYVNRV